MSLVVYRVAVLGLVIGTLASTVHAQDTPAEALQVPVELTDTEDAGPTPPDWVVTCTPDTDATKSTCQMAQSLFAEETGQPLVQAVIRPQSEDRQMGMLLTLPHGLYFPPGLSIRVDQGKVTDVAIQTSDQSGVYAAMPLTEEFVTAMKLGNNLNIALQYADGREVVLPLTLMGFTAAMEKLTSLL